MDNLLKKTSSPIIKTFLKKDGKDLYIFPIYSVSLGYMYFRGRRACLTEDTYFEIHIDGAILGGGDMNSTWALEG